MDRFTINTHHAYLNNDIVLKYDGTINVVDIVTGKDYRFTDKLSLRLSAGKHIFMSGDQEETVFIEDAIKLGGSSVKNAFVFEVSPWVFVTTKDRLYITNKNTKEEKVEYNIAPDYIEELGCENCDYFLFQTKNDYAIYDVAKGKMLFVFSNHIYSNDRLAIYKQDKDVVVYNFIDGKEILRVNNQYSFGSEFYFVKEDGHL